MSILSAPAGALVTLPEPEPPELAPPPSPPPLVATIATITTTIATPRTISRLFIWAHLMGDGRVAIVNMAEMEDNGRNETEKERLDRNLNELLGELRVAPPGAQVLFAFPLAVPFQQRFAQATEFEKGVYFVTVVATALAAAFLIAPSSMHRIEFRADDKRHVVFTANRFAIIGFAVLGVAMTSAVLLVTHFLYNDTLAAVTTTVTGVLYFMLWFALPLARLRKVNGSKPDTRKPDARKA